MTRTTRSHKILATAGVTVVAGLGLGLAADAVWARSGADNGRGNTSMPMPGADRGNRTGVGTGGQAQDRRHDGSCGTCTAPVSPTVATNVTPNVTESQFVELASILDQAMAEERLAVATYQAVLDEFGNVASFSNIVRSETRHVSSLQTVADRYGIDVSDALPGDVTVPATLADAYDLGIAVEIEDGDLYDTLIARMDAADIADDFPDVIRVFENLQAASLDKHLPAFEAYAS
ncbi:MAG: DUF2202 domain-containing protein [Ilumatobacteraceae bacterium]